MNSKLEEQLHTSLREEYVPGHAHDLLNAPGNEAGNFKFHGGQCRNRYSFIQNLQISRLLNIIIYIYIYII